ncbi:hypothetical protein H3V53_06345 [Paraburkholderia bengalensis]|uniref:Scaffolding protein n=1 Tax=Paraburkholderia bengalensis TaxID=2747562 RepID=A0ABU8IN04_9BURK
MEEQAEVIDQNASNGQESEEQRQGPVLFDDDLPAPAGGEGETEDDSTASGEHQTPPEGEENREPAQPAESRTFQEMRKNFNGALKDKRRLERELEELRSQLPKKEPELGPKPTLDQFDYDEAKFGEAYDAWMERKSALDRADQQRLNEQRRQQEELEAFKESYAARAKALGVDDFKESEAEVGSILNQTQTGLLMRGADDPAMLVYALSKSPERLIELSRITDPVKFTVAVAKMEMNLNTRKQNRPPPEPRISSERSTSANTGGSSALDRLREEAARTGDYSKVVAYKRQHNLR